MSCTTTNIPKTSEDIVKLNAQLEDQMDYQFIFLIKQKIVLKKWD